MQEINMTLNEFNGKFVVKVFDEERIFTEIGTDVDDNLIYHTSEEYHVGNAYSTVDRFYIIDLTEYDLLIDVALEDGRISNAYAVTQKNAVHLKYKNWTIDEEKTVPANVSRFKTILYQDENYTLGILTRPVFENQISECIVYRGKEYYLGSDPKKLTTFVFTKIKNYSRIICNAFYVKGVFDAFQAGKLVRAVTGVLYDPKKFCRLIAHVIDHKYHSELFKLEDACGISLPDVMTIEQLAQNIAERVINRETVMHTYRMKKDLEDTICQTAEDMSLRDAEMAYLPKIQMKNNSLRSTDLYQEWVSLELRIPYDSKNTYRLSLGLSHDKIILAAVVYEDSDKYYYRNNVTIAGCDVMKPGCEISKSTYTDNLVLYAVRCSAVLPLPSGQEYHKNDDLEGMFSTLQNLLQQQIKAERAKERDRLSWETSGIWAERTAERYKQEEMARIAQIKADAIAEEHTQIQKEKDRQASLDEQDRVLNCLFTHSENNSAIPRVDYEEWFALDYPCVTTDGDSSEIKHGSFGVWKLKNELFFVNRDIQDERDSENNLCGHEIELDEFKQVVLFAERQSVVSNEDTKKYIKNALKLRYHSKHECSSDSHANTTGSKFNRIIIEASEENIAALKDAVHQSNDLFMASRAEKHAAEVKNEDRCAAEEDETASVRRIFMQTEGFRFIRREDYEEWFTLDFKCLVDCARLQLERGLLGVDKSMNKLFFVFRSSYDLNDHEDTISGHDVDQEDFKQAVRYAERHAFISSDASADIIKKTLKLRFTSNAQKDGTQIKTPSSNNNDNTCTIKSEHNIETGTVSTVNDKNDYFWKRLLYQPGNTKLSKAKFDTWFSFERKMSGSNTAFRGSVGLYALNDQFYLINRDKSQANDDNSSMIGNVLSFNEFKELLFYAESKSFISRKKTNKFLNDAISIVNRRKLNENETADMLETKSSALQEERTVQKNELQEAVDHLKKGGELLFSSLASAASRLLTFGKKK